MLPRLASVLCCCVLLATLPCRAELSPETRAKINAGLPGYLPPAPEPEPAPPAAEPAPLSDDPLVRLPRYYVEDSRLSGVDPDKLLSRRQQAARALAAYGDSLTDLEWALNSWYIPLLGTRPSVRAQAYLREQKLAEEYSRLNRIFLAVSRIDAPAAARLSDALDPAQLPRGK